MEQKTVLLGYDLGLGVGYSIQLREIAKQLDALGVRPVVAVRSLDSSYRLFHECSFSVIQAPYLTGRLSPDAIAHGFSPIGFSDLMACNGFGSIDHLYSMQRGWRDLIDLVKPDLIVAVYAPLLTMAAFGRIPVVLFGPAYLTPPADGAYFPEFEIGRPPYADQGEMLETIVQVQRLFGAAIPSQITDVYRGQYRVIATLPELDPYRESRDESYAGLFEKAPAPERVDSESGPQFYAYLTEDDWTTRTLLDALVNSSLTGSIYLRDDQLRQSAFCPSSRIRLLDHLPILSEITKRSSVIIHHGGLGTTQAALAAGRPQFLAPRLLDQVLTAEAIAEQPFIDVEDQPEQLGDLESRIHSLSASAIAHESAIDFAHSIQERGLHNAAQRVVDACRESLA